MRAMEEIGLAPPGLGRVTQKLPSGPSVIAPAPPIVESSGVTENVPPDVTDARSSDLVLSVEETRNHTFPSGPRAKVKAGLGSEKLLVFPLASILPSWHPGSTNHAFPAESETRGIDSAAVVAIGYKATEPSVPSRPRLSVTLS